MKLVLKAVLVGGDPQPLTVGTQVERDRERLAVHAPRHAHPKGRAPCWRCFPRGVKKEPKSRFLLAVHLHPDRSSTASPVLRV